jgi:hypothetical protein
MRLLSRVVVVLVFSLIAVVLPSMAAQAVCVPYDIELSPESGPPGTDVTVYGHDFAAGALADIYYEGELIATNWTDSNGEFTLIFTVPEDCRGYYQVLADVGYAKVDTYFTVKPGLVVIPEQGPVGTNVTVAGKGFGKNEEGIELRYYYLNEGYDTVNRRIVANTKGSWEISFQIPSSARGDHKLDAQGAVTRLYEVKDATFRVTGEISLDRSSGIVGDSINIAGSRFAPSEKGIRILFDGEAVITEVKANSKGEWKTSFQVPEMPTGEHSIAAEGEQSKRQDVGEVSFRIEPDIVLSPAEGRMGTNLTVTGHGFAASEELAITYDYTQVATLAASDKGSFDVSFLVPKSPHGEHRVTAGYAGENHANAIFTIESNPPATPTPSTPANRSRLGLMGNVTPTFQWSEVSDDSGVWYSLQIAASDAVTGTGAFADPIVSVTGLVGTNYTLEETEALSQGTYYWIVQAVDGAENEGEWSAVHSFRVGLLPLWGLIVVIVAAVALLALLIRALVRRRTIYYDRW